MISKKVKTKILRKIALTMAVLILVETLAPSIAMALTSGPAQPEFQGFQQIGSSDMVDLFTGDFNYNIPLCEIGGYPLNLVYNSNPTMDDEASWVGLGWTLNPGSINRQMRGFPDDFMGDKVKKEFNLAPINNFGLTVEPGIEFLGKEIDDFTGFIGRAGINYNSTRGFELSAGVKFSPGTAIGKGNVVKGYSLGLSFAPSKGLDLDATAVGLPYKVGEFISGQNNISGGFNSRNGLKTLSLQNNSTFMFKVGKGDNQMNFSSETNTGLSLTPGPFTYTPTSPLPITFESVVYNATIGGEAGGAHPDVKVEGYSNRQFLEKNKEDQLAFGYLHLTAGSGNEDAHLDYNTELNGQFKVNTPYIPLAYGTPDLFYISGHGVGGQFKAVRNDVGVFRPAAQYNKSVGTSAGLELGAGGIAHVGGNFTQTVSHTSQKGWATTENNLSDNLIFTENGQTDNYEGVYFKPTGEQTLLPEASADIFSTLQQTAPIRIDNQRQGSFSTTTLATGNLVQKGIGGETSFAFNSIPTNKERVKRNQVISYLTVEEKTGGGLNKTINSYPKETDCPYDIYLQGSECTIIDEGNDEETLRPDHHIAELSVTNSSGGRYIYGQPVYNNLQRDVSFSIDPHVNAPTTVDDDSYGLVGYVPGDNTTGNLRGKDNYFDATQLPPYAHSYLLTGVLSPDYVDRLGDGITDDDPGDAVKFNYIKHNDNFNWRVPIQENVAKYHEGLRAKRDDDKASYIFGKKEIWYTYSIESRTMVARFYTSKRFDGLGVAGEDGGASPVDSLLKLDSIGIFSKADLLKNKDQAVPIKHIHFEYDYSLCPGVPNNMAKLTGQITDDNQGGKLTLKKVYFTYGKNRSGTLNAYKFDYKTNVGINDNDDSGAILKYNISHYDRWGCYQKNPDNMLGNHEFPYVLQEDGITEKTAGAWSLSEIELPSGSKIKVDYEPDDYAYVQDKRAGQMMEVVGFKHEFGSDTSKDFFDKNPIGLDNRKYIEVRIPNKDVTEQTAKQVYLEGIEQLYFNCLVQLKKNTEATEERVEGYATIDYSEEIKLTADTTLLIPIKYLKDDRGKKIHPIAYAAVQKTRFYYPELIYPGFDEDNAIVSLFQTLVGFVRELGNLLKGFTNNALRKGFGKKISDKSFSSWVRLNNPYLKKLGGGSRVSKLVISDEWTNGVAAEYGQTYTYEMPSPISAISDPVSSGVASYEPAIGGEENSLRTPLPYEEKYVLAPKNLYYSENPIGESLFPAPSIGYSRVVVKDITTDNMEVVRNQTGQTVHEFYTAKDFPTIVDKTKVQPATAKGNPILKFLKVNSSDSRSVSQGFTIELNDMHGKPKSQAILDRNNSLLSSSTYHYQMAQSATGKQQLSNEVDLLQKNNTVTPGQIGLSMEVWAEMQEENNENITPGKAKNVDVFVVPPIPFPIPFPRVFGISQTENTQFRSATITKLVQRTGILDKVVVMENGSTIETSNELYDAETGSVLLTKTQNEFDDDQYSFTYPAHWVYEGMGQAYENIGGPYTLYQESTTNNFIPLRYAPYFNPGDEVIIKRDIDTDYDPKRWFVHPKQVTGELIFVDEECNQFAWNQSNISHITVKIVRSRKRNLLNTSVASISSRKSPIDENGQLQLSDQTQILAANATVFSDDWKVQCQTAPTANAMDPYGIDPPNGDWQHNPYIEGLKGNWRPKESYALHDARTANDFARTDDDLAAVNNRNIQTSGTIDGFLPFWEYANNWRQSDIDTDQWIKSDSIGLYDFRGNQLEGFDAIGVSSAAYFGYNRTLAIAVANNAEYREIAYDGFEDYTFTTEAISSATASKDITFRRNLDFHKDHSERNSPIEEQVFPKFTHDSTGIAHTGKHALIVDLESAFYPLQKRLDDYCPNTEDTRLDIPPFKIDCADCQTTLKPYHQKEYAVSAWMATDSSLTCGVAPRDYGIRVLFKNKSRTELFPSTVLLKPSGPIIEGWQQMEEKILVPADAYYLEIAFGPAVADNFGSAVKEDDVSSTHAYFDDFRFHPWEASNMQSYVYDPVSERLMATLDENNYASFYEYNDEGILVRTKRETERGIVTIQEGRMVLKPNNSGN